MAHKPSTTSLARSRTRVQRKRAPIPESFQIVSSATIARNAAKIEVPMLVLYGEWLKAAGFPIGSDAVLTTDKHGELALTRLGLRFPRRLRVCAMPH